MIRSISLVEYSRVQQIIVIFESLKNRLWLLSYHLIIKTACNSNLSEILALYIQMLNIAMSWQKTFLTSYFKELLTNINNKY